MKFKLACCSILLASSFTCSAKAYISDDLTCPTADAIRSEGLSFSFPVLPKFYISAHQSQYNTAKEWTFTLAFIHANDTHKATEKGMSLIKRLQGKPQPEQSEDNNWLCAYEIPGEEYLALAIHSATPLGQVGIKQLVNKHQ
jgi:hypothetical protein